MSMISAQINELRKWADQLSERENEFGVVVRALVAALRDAADTIWQLRDDLQRANVENIRLRKLLLDVWNDAMQFDGFWDYVNDDGEIYNEDELPHYYERMRELGLEVK